MNKIKFAVIGCGHIGKRHAAMITQNSEAALCALIDIKEKDTLNIDHYDVPFFNSLKDFFNSGIDVDVICIATPNGLHYTQSIECLENQKNILVEKPIALKTIEAKEILRIAQQKNKNVFTVMQNRYSPTSIWIKSILESRIMGDIYMVQANCFWNRDERYYHEEGKEWRGTKAMDGGVLYTQFSHFIDIIYWLFGDIINIKTRVRNFNHKDLTEFDDSGFVTFDFINGGMGEINFSTSLWNANMESSLTIIAQNGSVKIGGQYMNEIQYSLIKEYTFEQKSIQDNNCNDYGIYKGSAANHQFVIENVVNFLKGRHYNLPNPEDSIAVINIIESIYNNQIH